MIRTYSDLRSLATLEERFSYLNLVGTVGEKTFGFDRWINQQFYNSSQWRNIRKHVIVRDNGLDLGVIGYEIQSQPIIHHMNPISMQDFNLGNADILDPEFLITTCKNTHNAIHYGDKSLLPQLVVERRPGDTKLW